MRKIILTITLAASFHASFAQSDSIYHSTPRPHYNQHIGVQINELVQQVLNFNNSGATNTINNNPYLLIYSINSARSGWGLRFGAGFTTNSNTTNDGISETQTNITDMHFRLGIDKAFKFSAKWSAGIGVDGLYNSNNNNTTATIRSSDTTTTNTKTKFPSYGGGVMGWLRYHVTKNIQIGTESSFYYTTGQEKDVIAVTKRTNDPGNFQSFPPITTTTTATSNKTTQGTFSVPVTLYLILKF
jgi:hypothetical protein